MAEGPFPEHYEPFETPLDTNPLHPEGAQQPGGAGVPGRPGGASASPRSFPIVATTYRLTEHFHFWTKHARITAILQPEQFVEIGEELARKKGIKQRRQGRGELEARPDQG